MPGALSAAEEAARLKLPGYNFGPPPDPARPKPRFIGVSPSKFNDICAEKVYRARIIGENNKRAMVESAARRLRNDGQIERGPADHLADVLPSRKAISRTYSRMGFTVCPLTSRILAPQFSDNVEEPDADGLKLDSASLPRPHSVSCYTLSSRTTSSRNSRRPITSEARGVVRSSSAAAGISSGPWQKAAGMSLSSLSQTASPQVSTAYEVDLGKIIRSRSQSELVIG